MQDITVRLGQDTMECSTVAVDGGASLLPTTTSTTVIAACDQTLPFIGSLSGSLLGFLATVAAFDGTYAILRARTAHCLARYNHYDYGQNLDPPRTIFFSKLLRMG